MSGEATAAAMAEGERKNAGGEEEYEVRRGPWTLEEDNLLTHYISLHGEGRWNLLAKCSGLKRTGKSCRLRWLNYLKPDIKRGNLSPQEQLLILQLQSKWGNRWSKIAQHLPGRTDNEIKNYWRTKVQKQARQLKIASNGKSFLEAVQTVWVPRLIEQMEQSSSSSSSLSSLSSLSNPNSACSPLPSYLENLLLAESASQESQKLDIFNKPVEKPNPEVIFSDSMGTVSQLPQCNCLLPNCLCVDTRGRDVDGFAQLADATSAVGAPFPYSEWAGDDMAGTLLSMDELWQFRMMEDTYGHVGLPSIIGDAKLISHHCTWDFANY